MRPHPARKPESEPELDNAPALVVRDLRIDLATGADVVDEIGFEIRRGEVLGLVGESGCGKTATAMACLGYARPGTRISRGEVHLGDIDLLRLSQAELRAYRGGLVSFVPQDPTAALNPGFRIEMQIEEMLAIHRPEDSQRGKQVSELLEEVRLPSDRSFRRRYPYQLSGGQQQRVLIAMALACKPRVVILDEPTTGLDVTTQTQILSVIDELRRTHALATLYVTHDLAVVAQIADHVAVMYSGRLVETAPREELFRRPRHPYTECLLAAVPRSMERRTRMAAIPGSAVAPGDRHEGCLFAPRCHYAIEACTVESPPAERVEFGHEVRCFRWFEVNGARPLAASPDVELATSTVGDQLLVVSGLIATYPKGASTNRRDVVLALRDVSFSVGRGETLGVVGESGSGKTTLGRCLVGLHPPSAGRILFDNAVLPGRAVDRNRRTRQRIQIVFQNPDESLNPRHTVASMVGRPLAVFFAARKAERMQRAAELLDLVRLPRNALGRYPSELSGGEKQRVAIACALAARPELVICDEITSALDVSVQAAILELLAELRSSLEMSLIFISHDLAVVRSVADQIVVLQSGEVRECGQAEVVFHHPQAAYTRELLAAVPQIREPVVQDVSGHA